MWLLVLTCVLGHSLASAGRVDCFDQWSLDFPTRPLERDCLRQAELRGCDDIGEQCARTCGVCSAGDDDDESEAEDSADAAAGGCFDQWTRDHPEQAGSKYGRSCRHQKESRGCAAVARHCRKTCGVCGGGGGGGGESHVGGEAEGAPGSVPGAGVAGGSVDAGAAGMPPAVDDLCFDQWERD